MSDLTLAGSPRAGSIAAPAGVAASTREALLWWAALAATCIALLAPLCVVDVPPLLDYPNHLARALILAFPDNPDLARIAAPHWLITPNLGLDLLLPPLLHILPIHIAGRILIAVAVLLPVLGCIALHRAIFGTRSWWPFGAALVAYSETLLLGFLNFQLALGLALLAAAGWISWRATRPAATIAAAILGAVLLFFCHLMGLALFVVLAASWEIARPYPSLRAVCGRWALLTAVLTPAMVLYLLSPLEAHQVAPHWPSVTGKLHELLAPVTNYVLALDLLTAMAVGLILSAGALTGWLRFTRVSGLATGAVALLFVLAPSGIKGTEWFDTRFVIMLGCLLFAGLRPRVPRHAGFAAAMLLLTLFAARQQVLIDAWAAHAADVRDLRRVIALVRPGQTVMETDVSPREAPAYWRTAPLARRLSDGMRTNAHLPALLMIERHAFWPFLFDDPTQQPVQLLPAYRQLAEQVRGLPDHRVLLKPGAIDLRGYDWLLLLDAGGEPDLAHFAADRLQLEAQTGAAALFRVIHEAPVAVSSVPGQKQAVE